MFPLETFSRTHLQTLAVVGIISVALYALPSGNGGDVIAYWGATQAILQGLNPYDPTVLLPIQQQAVPTMVAAQRFLNPPWAIPILTPLFSAPFHLSRALLLLVNFLAFAYATHWCARRWGPLPRLGALAIALYLPFLSCQFMGQLSVFPMVGLLILLDDLPLRRNSPLKMALGFYLCSIKPQALYLFLALLPVYLIQRDGLKRVVNIALYGIPIFALLLWRHELVGSWIESFDYSTRWRTATTTTYLRDLLHAYLPSYSGFYWTYQGMWLSLLFIPGLKRAFSVPWVHMIVILSALTAPYSWLYDFCILLPPYYMALARLSKQGERTIRFYLSILIVVSLTVPVYGSITKSFEIFIIHSIGVAVLFCLQSVLKDGEAHRLSQR